MNETDIALIKDSFSRIEDSNYDYSKLFYDILFRDTPSAAALFKNDPEEQRKKLKTVIALVVKGLERFDQLESAILDMGKRHVGYGVHPDDFADVADALMKAFNEAIGGLSVDEEQAWLTALNAIFAVMLPAWESDA